MIEVMNMTVVKLLQYIWYNPREVEFHLPDSWHIEIYNIAGYNRPAMTSDEIKAAIASPIGMPPIREIAKGKKQVVILFDDMTRSTQVDRIAPFILGELAQACIDSQIRFIAAIGTHGALDRTSLVKKLGEDIMARFPVYNHSPFANCTYVGTTSYGTNVSVNAEVMSCDLKIGIGQIAPHIMTGFSGGGKIILPGVSSYETIEAHHGQTHEAWKVKQRANAFHAGASGAFKGNPMNADIQEAAKLAGLDVIIDSIVNMWGDTVALFAGALEPSYKAGVEAAKSHYFTPATQDNDIVIANAYTKASEILGSVLSAYPAVSRKGGDVVIIGNSPPGQAILYLLRSWGKTIGGSLYHPHQIPTHINHLIIYTEYPEANLFDSFTEPDKVLVLSNWHDVVRMLQEFHGAIAKVAVFPSADIQYSL